MLSFFTALSLAPLAQVTALSFTAPLFAALGAALILGEVMRIRRWTALLVGFAGALIIIRPGIVPLDTGTLLTLLASTLWATAMLVIKTLSRTDSSVTLTLYMGIFLTPLTFLFALTVWVWPTSEQLLWLVFLASMGTIGHLCMAQAFKETEATVVLPFDFARLIWASTYAFFFFAETPDLWTWIGGAVIFSAATYIAYRESRLKEKKPQPESGVS
jgi:drug/metabolite transporter (DMT)-like permease